MPESTLSVWAFDTPDGAERAVRALQDIQREKPLVVLDHATVSWDPGKKKPVARQGPRSRSTAAFDGSFWGMLFGLIFFVPLLAAAVGAAAGGFAGSMADVGIDDRFVKKVRSRVTPGTSALFLMTSRAVLDQVRDLLSTQAPADLIYTTISEEQGSALRRVFGGGPPTSRRRGSDLPQSRRAAEASTPTTPTTPTTLTVWHYSSAMGAPAGEVRLRDLEDRGAVTIVDAIPVVWLPATLKPRIGRIRFRTGPRARRATVPSALADPLLLAPLADAAVGEDLRALAGRLRHAGVDEAFLHEIERGLTPGTSALLVLSENAAVEAITAALVRGLSPGEVTLVHAVPRDDVARSTRRPPDAVPSRPFGAPGHLEPAAAPVPPLRSVPSASSHRHKETL